MVKTLYPTAPSVAERLTDLLIRVEALEKHLSKK